MSVCGHSIMNDITHRMCTSDLITKACVACVVMAGGHIEISV